VRRSLLPATAAAALLALSACSSADEPEDATGAADGGSGAEETLVPVEESAELLDREGSTVGRAWLRDDAGRAVLELQLTGLTAGFHPVQLGESGSCEADDPGALLDLPPLLVLEEGVGSMTTLAGSMPLDELLADDGTAVLLGESVEGLGDLPTGSETSGAEASRVACGVVGG
jgi:Cu-Zn family superoxide dismutase